MTATTVQVCSREQICFKQIRSLLRKARAGDPYSGGTTVTYCTGVQQFLPLVWLVWRYHALRK